MRKTLQIVIGFVIGFGLLWLLFKDTDWGQVWQSMQEARLSWVVLTIVTVLLAFVTRIQRWTYVVRTAKPVSFRHMFSATQIGFLANFTLPGRAGEVVRALVLTRLTQLPFPKTFAMVALDRVLDLIGLVVVVFIVLLAYAPSTDVVIPADVFGREIPFNAERIRQGEIIAIIGLIGSLGGLVLLYVNQRLVLRISDAILGLFSKGLAQWAHGFLEHFAEGLHIFRSASDMAKAIVWSLITWAFCISSIFLMLKAFNINGPWYTVFVMELLLALAISVPGAPGFVGQFHVPIVIGVVMVVPGTPIADAKALAIITHLLNLILVVLVGLYCLFKEDFRLTELTRSAAKQSEEQDDSAPESGGKTEA